MALTHTINFSLYKIAMFKPHSSLNYMPMTRQEVHECIWPAEEWVMDPIYPIYQSNLEEGMQA